MSRTDQIDAHCARRVLDGDGWRPRQDQTLTETPHVSLPRCERGLVTQNAGPRSKRWSPFSPLGASGRLHVNGRPTGALNVYLIDTAAGAIYPITWAACARRSAACAERCWPCLGSA
jgi:hypothetical protein